MNAILVLIMLAFWCVATPALGQQTILHFKSEPGDFIGGGQEVTLTTDEVDFFPQRFFDGGVHFFINNFSRPDPPSVIWWIADFTAPDGMDLIEGAYENATRWPFQAATEPGLSFVGDGRGCNTLTGRFDVLEAVYDPATDAVISFAVDFEQHCEGSEPALFGSIRFNSDFPLPVLLPPRITMLNDLNRDRCVEATGPDGATVALSGSSSSDAPVDFLWSTSAGDLGSGTEFSFQLGVGQFTEVTLTIEDLVTGEQASSALTVCASDTTPPQVMILSPNEGDIFVGENAELSVQVSDVVDQSINGYRVFVANTSTVPLDASTGRSRIKLFRKIHGETIRIEITAEAQDFSGNTGAATVTVFRAHDLGLSN